VARIRSRAGSPRGDCDLLVGSVLGDFRPVDAREPAVGVPAAVGVHDACAYFVYKGSSESPDGGERLEAKLDVLLERYGVDPLEIEMTLPAKYRRRR